MISKKRVKIFLLLILSFYLLFSFLMNLLVDPFGKYHILEIEGFNKDKYNYEQLTTMGKIMSDPDIDTLVFGTSRTAILGKDRYFIEKESRVLNLSDAIYGNPRDIYDCLLFILKYNNHIKEIYVGIDIHVFDKNNLLGRLRNQLFYTAPKTLSFVSDLIKLTPVYNSLSFYNVQKNRDGITPKAPQDDYGVRSYLHETLDRKKAEFPQNIQGIHYRAEDLNYFREIDNLAEKNGIRIYFFTFPNNVIYYQNEYRYDDVVQFYKEISLYIHFYNFSYINRYTKNQKNYYDGRHYTPALSQMILDAIHSGKDEEIIDGERVFRYIRKPDDLELEY